MSEGYIKALQEVATDSRPVVMESFHLNYAKYAAAMRHKIKPCTIDWVLRCVELGRKIIYTTFKSSYYQNLIGILFKVVKFFMILVTIMFNNLACKI